MKYLTPLVSITLLSACAVGPDYQRPAVDIPASFQYVSSKAQQDALDTEWWRQFNDPVLDQYVQEAVQRNRNLAIALANINAAAGQLTVARSALYPSIGYQAGAARGLSSSERLAGGQRVSNSYQVAGNVNWEIDLWGGLRRQSESAKAQLEASKQARRGILLSVAGATVQTYLQLRGLDQQLRIAKDTVNSYQRSVELFELQFKYGVIARITLEQVRSQYQEAQSNVPPIEKAIVSTENALSILMGRNPGPITRGKALDALTAPVIPSALPSSLLSNRPDILEAERQLEAANAQIGVARAQYFPQISLTSLAGGVSEQLSNLLKAGSSIWSLAAQASGSVFSGGSTQGQVKTAEAQTQAAEQRYLQTIQQSFADVENALSSYQADGKTLNSLTQLVNTNLEYSTLASLQYNGGLAPYLTVLDAQRQAYSAQQSATSARVAYLSSAANLYLSLGGDWINQLEQQSSTKPTQN
ncbi:efflux transporter outer membrane subunit [uncultured Deefgea sp.]|uniref:efflux transporter outer membrane subunit n=1 Tax=uncultured Deefgea sp. TaxID=1304914 RepID=UPI00260FC58F|nr:efflux transporter outer membrane subunit [uncultured Deefgea sp.]